MNQNSDYRVDYIDVARGIAMICIVIGHLGIWGINRIVFTFHVPIFYLITGYFSSSKRTLKEVINKRFRTLIVPYLVTCFIICVLGFCRSCLQYGFATGTRDGLMWLYASLYGAGDSYDSPFYIKGIGAIWFLWATFWGCIFLQLSMKFNKYIRLVFVLGLFFAGYYSRLILWFPLSIQAGCCATLFMYFGYLVKIHKEQICKIPVWIRFILVGIATAMWGNFIVGFKSFWLVHCDVGRGLIDIIGCLCACSIVLLLSKVFLNRIGLLSSFFAFLGRNSILMLCIHIIELDVFPWRLLTDRLLQLNSLYASIIMIVVKLSMIIGLMCIALRMKIVRDIYKCYG